MSSVLKSTGAYLGPVAAHDELGLTVAVVYAYGQRFHIEIFS